MSSSVEPSATSAVASLTDLSLSDERLKNLKQKAEEAARKPFLWELGLRAESPSQVPQICQRLLDVSDDDEKLAKAVAVLKRSAPHVLEEIGVKAAPEGARSMKVVYGPKHFSLLCRTKDGNLWESICRRLNLPIFVMCKSSPDSPLSLGPRGLCLDVGFFVVDPDMDRSSVVVWKVGDKHSCDLPRYSVLHSWAYKVISIQPISVPLMRDREFRINAVRSSEQYSFYASPGYFDALVSVRDRKFLSLAKKIAAAYEQETRRRRRPAEAIVSKNY